MLRFGAAHVLNGQITIGELTVLISYIASVYQPLEQIGHTVGNLHQNFVFLNASMGLLDVEPEIQEKPDAVDIGRARGELALDNVTFGTTRTGRPRSRTSRSTPRRDSGSRSSGRPERERPRS